jgi:hypothetical protein
MTERASLILTAGRSGLVAIPALPRVRPARRVAGKSQLVLSALGMAIALGALIDGAYLAAALVFLLTLGILELMFRRALAQFHASCGRPYRRPGAALRPSSQPGLSDD